MLETILCIFGLIGLCIVGLLINSQNTLKEIQIIRTDERGIKTTFAWQYVSSRSNWRVVKYDC